MLLRTYSIKNQIYILLAVSLSISSIPAGSAYSQESQQVVSNPVSSKKLTAEHKLFDALKGPFSSAEAVTDACLSCHTEASKQVMESIHWRWEYEHPDTGQVLGKQHVINAFCGNLKSNEARCTSCHAGYGWEDAKTFDFAAQEKVDCLVCHDRTGEYIKWNDRAGHPLYESVTQASRHSPYPESLITVQADGRFRHQPPDLPRIAMNVGEPSRENCGNCHFYGGGGDNVKHGDLSTALLDPSLHVDVHMSSEGGNMLCIDCHVSNGHHWPGSRYLGTVKDDTPRRPGFRNPEVLACDTCHTDTPHDVSLEGLKLNAHTDKVACQSCHIPEFAKGGKGTKTWWDWSTAGKLKDGKPYAEHDEKNRHTYLSTKGDFRWEEDVVPDYQFWNGIVEYTLLGEKIDPDNTVGINRIYGAANDEDSLIYPFKHMRGRQAFDTQNNNLLFSQVYGPDTDTAFWTNFDWGKALQAGMKDTGVPYSGKFGFVDTEMWWPTTHMVAPADEALSCDSCHAKQGRLAALGGFYLPGRDEFPLTDRVGKALFLMALLGIAVHAAVRVVMHRRRR